MNNLVSRNPVQRFKEGRKIVIAENGFVLDKYKEITPKQQAKYNKEVKKSPLYVNHTKVPYEYDLDNHDASSYLGEDLYYSDMGPYEGKDKKFYSGLVNDFHRNRNNNYQKAYDMLTHNFKGNVPLDLERSYAAVTQQKSPQNSITTETEVKDVKTPGAKTKNTKKTIYPQTKFMGVVRGGNVINFNNAINADQKAKLIASGSFTNADFANTTTFQRALNRYFGKDGYGSVVDDGMWGNQTQRAFDEAMKKINAPIVNTTEGIKFQNGLTPTTAIGSMIKAETNKYINTPIDTSKININIPQQTYDRAGIREYLRSKGLNPYSFSGAQRRALRMIMNGQGTDNDKLLVRGMNIFKQGGLLVSKNPVTRFKNKNFS